MEDKELYQHILGLKTPWSVREVNLDMKVQQIDIQTVRAPGAFLSQTGLVVPSPSETRLLNLFRLLPKQEQRRLIDKLEASQRQRQHNLETAGE